MPDAPRLRGPGGRPLRVAHLTTVDMSLELLLGTELSIDVETGLHTYGLSAPGPYVPDVQRRGVTYVPLDSLTRSWDPRRDLAATVELARQLRRLRLDVLHTHNPKTGVIGRILGRGLGVPVVVNTCHGLWAQAGDSMQRRSMVLCAEALAAQFSHAELYQNADDAATLAKAVAQWRAKVVGNGVDLVRFTRSEAERARVRAEWGIGDDELLIGGVGRRVAEKGIAEFVQTARALAGRARFVWIGPEDPDKPDALAGDDDAVTWIGNRSDMPAVYSALDVFVLPSYREGFSRSAMEAASCGLPMVLSDIRGCREIGRDGDEVLLVPAGDPTALTAAIGQLIDEPGTRQDLAVAVAERSQAFDQRGVAAWSLRTYAAVARRKGLGWEVG